MSCPDICLMEQITEESLVKDSSDRWNGKSSFKEGKISNSD